MTTIYTIDGLDFNPHIVLYHTLTQIKLQDPSITLARVIQKSDLPRHTILRALKRLDEKNVIKKEGKNITILI